jgi:hypothetical protein
VSVLTHNTNTHVMSHSNDNTNGSSGPQQISLATLDVKDRPLASMVRPTHSVSFSGSAFGIGSSAPGPPGPAPAAR